VKRYNILEMEATLRNATTTVRGQIKEQFRDYLSDLADAGLNRETLSKNAHVAIYNLRDHSSLGSVYSMPGFYIICTDHAVADNLCTFSVDNKQMAIYRGECSSVRRRVESHLFNDKYQVLYEQRKREKLSNGKKFSEPYYGACIKIEPTVSGINIDAEPYNNSNWTIIVFKMPRSSSPIRKQAELAFDALFERPVASRE
jgi:hypothetical protein